MSQKIAFLGLGLMGGSMAANLARKGYYVLGWNRSDRLKVKIAAQAGVNIVTSLEKAVADAEIIFTCLGDVPDVKQPEFGLSILSQIFF